MFAILATSPAAAQNPKEPSVNPPAVSDGQDSAPIKPKKKKKDLEGSSKAKKEDAAEGSAPEAKSPKHPSWRIGNVVKLDFKSRIETEVRTATPAMGFDSG